MKFLSKIFTTHPTLTTHLSQNNSLQQFADCKHYIETKQIPPVRTWQIIFAIWFQGRYFNLPRKKEYPRAGCFN